ncbi:MAG: universal stress protein [Balneolaceae bacterium]|nr:universal stress protein [Balneolaceae bacterium]
MKNYKILVPLDFSDLGANALHSAARMAELYNGSVTPFHSYLPVSELDAPYDFGVGPTTADNFDDMEVGAARKAAGPGGKGDRRLPAGPSRS